MSKPNISVVINTKNSAATIERTLQSIQSIADEIVVVDMESQDKTGDIVRRYTKKIFTFPDQNFVEPARDFAIAKAGGRWIFIIDADEEINSGLRDFLQRIKDNRLNDRQRADAYLVPRKNVIFGQWIKHTGWWPDYQLRLFLSGRVKWPSKLHAKPIVKGRTLKLPARDEYSLIHHNYQTVEQFVDRLNRYTTIAANEAAIEKEWSFRQIFHEYWQELLRRFFAQQGWRDGRHGLALSLLQANYQLIIGLKIWQKQKFIDQDDIDRQIYQEMRQWQRDLNYWLADWRHRQSPRWQKWYWRWRKKMKI